MKFLLLNLLVFSVISMSACTKDQINPLSNPVNDVRDMVKERVALVIGNSNYRVNPLSNPVNDARDMAKVLRELGFDVTLEVDADQMTMESAIDAFGDKLRKSAKAVGLFYFSGHGAQYAGTNYLIPINSIRKISAAAHLRYKAVPAGYVLGVMPENGLNIVILDACRNNPFKGFSKSLGQGLARMAGAEGSLIAYATAPGTVAWAGKASERNSPYTKHLLRFMKQPNLPIESILKKVRKAVILETRHNSTVQKPWYEASISDDFYFIEDFQTIASNVSIDAKIKAFANQMSINYEEIAEHQELDRLYKGGTDNIRAFGAAAVKGKWENTVLLSLISGLASISQTLEISAKKEVSEPTVPLETLDQMMNLQTGQLSQLFFKSEPTFNLKFVWREMVESVGVGLAEVMETESESKVTVSLPDTIYKRGHLQYIVTEKCQQKCEPAGECQQECELGGTDTLVDFDHTPADISAKQLRSIVRFMRKFGIKVTHLAYYAGKKPVLFSCVAFELETAKAKGFYHINKALQFID